MQKKASLLGGFSQFFGGIIPKIRGGSCFGGGGLVFAENRQGVLLLGFYFGGGGLIWGVKGIGMTGEP